MVNLSILFVWLIGIVDFVLALGIYVWGYLEREFNWSGFDKAPSPYT